MKYIIVTVLKNEATFVPELSECVINQKIAPYKWIIVDDSSTDNSYNLLSSFAETNPWIIIVQIKKHNLRGYGSRIAELRNIGYSEAMKYEFDLLCHLDADILLPPNYYFDAIQAFSENGNLGICGGTLVNLVNGKRIIEKSANYHVRDAVRVYRKECFIDIGAQVLPIWSHDSIDIMMALRAGWQTKNLKTQAIHLRPTAESQKKIQFFSKSGFEYYKIGASPLLIIIRSVKHLSKKPYLVCSVVFLFGYIKAFIKGEKKVIDKSLAKFINKHHYSRILKKPMYQKTLQ